MRHERIRVTVIRVVIQTATLCVSSVAAALSASRSGGMADYC